MHYGKEIIMEKYHPDIGLCYVHDKLLFGIFSVVRYWNFENELETEIVLTSKLLDPVKVKKDNQ